MQLNKKTFCSAPWFQIRNQNNMTKKVCCEIKPFAEDSNTKNISPLQYLNLPHIKQLKKQLADGQKPDACDACWRSEDSGNISLRQILNESILGNNEKNWSDSYFKHKNNFDSDIVVSADVKIGNTCNHACVMCNADQSTLLYADWYKRKDSPFVQDYLKQNPNYFEEVKFQGYKNKTYRNYLETVIIENQNLKVLKILGGEPFLDNTLIKILKRVPETQKRKITLVFVTNGSIDVVPVLEYIGDYKSVSIVVSIEGVGKVQEFARAGSEWQKLEANILKAKQQDIDVRVNHTMQTATILGFKELLKWCAKNKISINCSMVDDPDYLSIQALPVKLKQKIIDDIMPFEENFSNKVDQETGQLTFYKLILKIKDINFDPKLHKRFFEYIDWYQCNKKIPKLETIFPELYLYS